MSKNHIPVAVSSHINNIVNAVVARVATTPKGIRAANRAYRPSLISLAYALFKRNGEVSTLGLFIVSKGLTVEGIQQTVSAIRKEVSATKVAANTLKVRSEAAVASVIKELRAQHDEAVA
jgi:hypothetical protein